VLGRSHHAAVAVEAIVAFPKAVRFDVVAMVREPFAEDESVERQPWGGTSIAFHCMWPPYDPGPGFVRFGVRFSDGTRFDNLTHQSGGGGSGGPTYGRGEFWVTQTPTPGPVSLFVQWDAVDIPEQSIDVDGESIRAACARSVTPWTE